MRLLLLDDDAILGEGLRDYLRNEGHVVEWFTRLSAVQGMVGEPFDALLVDWSQLPYETPLGLHGFAGCTWLERLNVQRLGYALSSFERIRLP